MQGPPPPISTTARPPMSVVHPMSPVLAPPLKKVRADAATTSPNSNAANAESRRMQLAQLQKGLTNYSSSSSSSTSGPPPPLTTFNNTGSSMSSVVNIGGPPLGGGGFFGSGGGGGPPLGSSSSSSSTPYSTVGPPLGSGGSNHSASSSMSNNNRYSAPAFSNNNSNTTTSPYTTKPTMSSSSLLLSSSGPPTTMPQYQHNQQQSHPPAFPGRSGPAAAMRTSDIFPSVPKTSMTNIGNSISSSSASVSAVASRPPVARRLDDSLAKAQSNSSSGPPRPAPGMVGFVGGGSNSGPLPPSRPKSAPPRRPPPPPPNAAARQKVAAAEAPEAGGGGADRHTVRRPSPLVVPGPTVGPPPSQPPPPSAGAPTSAAAVAPTPTRPPPPTPPPSGGRTSSSTAPPPPTNKATAAATGPPRTNQQPTTDNSSVPSLTDEVPATGPPPTGLQTPVPKTKVGGGVAFSEATPKVISPGPSYYADEPERTVQTPGGPSVNTAHAGQTPYPGKTSINTAHAGQTPYPGKILGGPLPPTSSTDTDKSIDSSNSGGGITSRRDLVRGMYDIADTPIGQKDLQLQLLQEQSSPSTDEASSPPFSPALKINESHELRMQKELARSEKEKAGALHKVADLEDELRHVKLELAAQKTPGHDNKQQQHHVGFLSPVALGGSASNLLGLTMPQRQHRAPTPHPKRKSNGNNSNNNNKNDDDFVFLKKAANCVPHEYVYDNDTVMYVIRRPFGVENQKEFWSNAGQAPNHMYDKKVNIHDSTTVEIAAQIAHDNSIFFLHGAGMVRHKTIQVNGLSKWKDLGNAMESALGNVMYIDSEANEKEYSLDNIFDQALAVRNTYCASMISTSLGLQQGKEETAALTSTTTTQPPPPMMMMQQQSGGGPAFLSPPSAEEHHVKKAEMNDACVGTEDLEYKPQLPPHDGEQQQQQQQQQRDGSAPKLDASSGKGAAPPPVDQHHDESAGILTSFLGLFLATIISLVKYICFTMVFKILETVIVLCLGTLIVGLIWLYLSDDHGAAAHAFSMNAYYWNPPGIM